jgi:hypothetical protein
MSPVDMPVTRDEEVGKQERLFGVICDRAGGHPASGRVVGVRGEEARDGAVSGGDRFTRDHLQRHAEGVTDRETLQRGEGATAGGHPQSCALNWN